MLQTPDISMILILVIFLAIVGIANRNLFLPLSAILREREEESSGAAARLEKARAEFEAAAERIERELSLARQEALRLREELRGEGHRLREEKVSGVRGETAAKVAEASAAIRESAGRASRELPSQTAALSRVLAEKVLGRSLAA